LWWHIPESFTWPRPKSATSLAKRNQAIRNYRLPHAGETAIGNFFAKIDEIIDPKEPVLIVFEDTKIRRRAGLLQENIHFISTAALLLGMEKAGLIQSADAIWKAMEAAGRTPLKEVIEVAAPRGSRWLPQPWEAPTGGAVNPGGLKPNGAPVIPLSEVADTRFTFNPARRPPGPSYVQALNPQHVSVHQFRQGPGGAFTLGWCGLPLGSSASIHTTIRKGQR
jgi:hypothetical protein